MNGKNINFNDKKLKKKLNFTKIKKYLIEINRHLVSFLKTYIHYSTILKSAKLFGFCHHQALLIYK